MALQLHHGDHDARYHQRRDRARRDQGGEDGDTTGHDGANDRDERAEEDQGGWRYGWRNTQDGHPGPDAGCVDARLGRPLPRWAEPETGL